MSFVPVKGVEQQRLSMLHRAGDGVPELGKLARPVMRTAAGLRADETRRQLGKERQAIWAMIARR
jgi:hypothetical protein